MNKLLRLIRILFTKDIGEEDLVDIWLILFFWTTSKEQKPFYRIHSVDGDKVTEEYNTREFHLDHQVKEWQHNLWRRIAFFKVRRISSHWGWDRLWIAGKRTIIPFPYRFITSKHLTRRSMPMIDLQCSPSIKYARQ